MPLNTIIVSASQDGAIDRAVEKLARGELVAVPTETVYGLAGDAFNQKAVLAIFTAKGRPANNPLICHVASSEMAKRFIDVSPTAQRLMDEFWPGPLTLVSTRKKNTCIAPAVTAGLDTLAVRCPKNTTTKAIIAALDRPIAAPSANLSGKLSPTTAHSVLKSLKGRISMVIDDGQTDVGIESTIVGVEGKQITLLRPGSVTVDEISSVAGTVVHDRNSDVISAPGQLASHYAPESDVLLDQNPECRHFFIGFGNIEGDLNLSVRGDLTEAAHNLFEMLRKADGLSNGPIAIAPIPDHGIGIAINDRLKRAAAVRGDK